MSGPGLLTAVVAVLFALSAAPAAAAVRINQMQVVGSHNSYHLEASAAERAIRRRVLPDDALAYSHAPLGVQLAQQQVRQLELDVFADPQGGRYAAPRLRALAGEGPYYAAMLAPGSKVLHIQDYDYRSTCLSLVACLGEVKAWSDGNRRHVPVMILLELRDDALPAQVPSTTPVRWTSERMKGLEDEIRSVFPRNRLLVPDDVRRGSAALESAVRRKRWPTVASSRGKVMFVLDNEAGRIRRAYLAGHPSLRGRLMFTASAPGRADAAVIKVDDPRGRGLLRIQRLVQRGYMVRTRADAHTIEARRNSTRRRNNALRSGAHWISTDYPAPGMAARFGSPYVVRLGRPARCNPVTASRCRTRQLEF